MRDVTVLNCKVMGAFRIGLIKWNVTSDYEFLSPKKIPQILGLLT